MKRNILDKKASLCKIDKLFRIDSILSGTNCKIYLIDKIGSPPLSHCIKNMPFHSKSIRYCSADTEMSLCCCILSSSYPGTAGRSPKIGSAPFGSLHTQRSCRRGRRCGGLSSLSRPPKPRGNCPKRTAGTRRRCRSGSPGPSRGSKHYHSGSSPPGRHRTDWCSCKRHSPKRSSCREGRRPKRGRGGTRSRRRCRKRSYGTQSSR